MKFIKADVLVLLSISPLVFTSVDQRYTGDRGAIWDLGPLGSHSYMI